MSSQTNMLSRIINSRAITFLLSKKVIFPLTAILAVLAIIGIILSVVPSKSKYSDLSLSITLEVPRSGVSEVFIDSGASFNANERLDFALEGGKHTYTINLPAKRIRRLRFDVMNYVGDFNISKIVFSSKYGSAIFEGSELRKTVSVLSAATINEISKNGILGTTHSADPNLEISPIPSIHKKPKWRNFGVLGFSVVFASYCFSILVICLALILSTFGVATYKKAGILLKRININLPSFALPLKKFKGFFDKTLLENSKILSFLLNKKFLIIYFSSTAILTTIFGIVDSLKEYPVKYDTIYAAIEMEVPSQGKSQIYYNTGNSYHDGEVANFHVFAGKNFYKIPLASKPIYSIRFDIMNYVGDFKIYSISFQTRYKKYTIKGESLLSAFSPRNAVGGLKFENGGLVGKTYSADPFGEIGVPLDVGIIPPPLNRGIKIAIISILLYLLSFTIIYSALENIKEQNNASQEVIEERKRNKLKGFEWVFFSVILVVGIVYATTYTSFGLPDAPHVDETAITMANIYPLFEGNSFSPKQFLYPSLTLYTGKIVLHIAKIFGAKTDWDSAIRLLRAFFAILNAFSVLFLYFGVRKLFGKYSAMLASILAMFSLWLSASLFYIGPDTFLFFWANLLFWVFSLLYKAPKNKNNLLFALSFFLIGLASAVKYNGVFLCIMPFFVFLDKGIVLKPKKYFLLGLMCLLVPIAFAITNPYAIMRSTEFVNDFLWNVNHYESGHEGLEPGSVVVFYINHFLLTSHGYAIFLFLIPSLTVLFLKKSFRDIIFLLVVPLAFIVMLGRYKVGIGRNIILTLPYFFALSSAVLSTHFIDRFSIKIRKTTIVCFIIIASVFSVEHLIRVFIYAFSESSFEASKEWIHKNIEDGSKIVTHHTLYRFDGYFPKIDTSKYSMEYLEYDDYSPENIPQGAYCLVSSVIYGKYIQKKDSLLVPGIKYRNPDKAKWVSQVYINSDLLIHRINGSDSETGVFCWLAPSYKLLGKYSGPTFSIYKKP